MREAHRRTGREMHTGGQEERDTQADRKRETQTNKTRDADRLMWKMQKIEELQKDGAGRED